MSDQELELLEGSVSAVIFQNEENGYTILKLDVHGEEVTVVGPIAGVAPGEYLSVRGRWTRHPTYGPQMRAELVERRLPQGLKEIFHYLSSGAVKGVGKVTARNIIEEFGEDALTVIEDEPEQLTKIKGITLKRARQIGEMFRQQMGARRLLEFLSEHGLPMELSGCAGPTAMWPWRWSGPTPICWWTGNSRWSFRRRTPWPCPWGWKPGIPCVWRRGCSSS